MAKTYVSIRDRVTTLVDRVNDITNLIGDPQRLDSAGYGTYAPFDSAGLLGDSDLVTALWEIKHKFDSADALIDQAVLTSSTPNFDEVYLSVWNNGVPGTNQLKIDSGGISRAGADLTIDGSADIILDADGGDVLLKDDGTQYAAFTNTSGNLIIKSGSITAATFTGNDVLFADSVGVTGALSAGGAATFGSTLEVDGNTTLLGTLDISDSSRVSSNLTVLGNFNTTDSSRIGGNFSASGTGLFGGNLTTNGNFFAGSYASIQESNGQLVLLSSSRRLIAFDSGDNFIELYADIRDNNLTTSAKTIVSAINQLDTRVAGLDSNFDSDITVAFADIGSLFNLTTTTDSNLVAAVNELDAEIGNLASLSTTAKSNVVASINETYARIPDIYDSDGTLLN